MALIATDRILLQNILNETNVQTFCVSAPNFESRSIASLHWLRNVRAPIYHYFVQIKPDAMHKVEALEQVKRFHLERAQGLARHGNKVIQVDYPKRPNGIDFGTAMDQKFPTNVANYILIVDLTALPRRVIVDVLSWLSRLLKNGHNVQSVYFIYTWAERHTTSKYPEKMVSLLRSGDVAFSSESVVDVRQEDFKAILYTSRHGAEGQTFISCLPPGVSPEMLVFFDPSNPLVSLDRIRSNFVYLNSNADRVRYYFSMDSAHEMLVQSLRGFQPHRKFCLLVAPFGPKPCTVSAWLCCEAMKDKFRNLEMVVDITALHSQEYNSLYSIGHRHISVYQFDLRFLKSPKTMLM
jgi:hypothetical protein